MTRPISDYITELERLLPGTGWQRRRTINEVRDHLLDRKSRELERGVSDEQAESLAVLRFGPVEELARRLGGGQPLPGRRRHAVRTGDAGKWIHRHASLALFLVALFLTATILPSALNLPQSNPSQTLEYAPVPGESNASREGNVSSLGLGSSGGLGSLAGQGLEEEQTSAGVGARPSTKRCVGKPLRQTEDPLSPPCVAVFEGSNGGATYQGVTRDEVRIVIYTHGNANFGDEQSENGSDLPKNTYIDLAQPPASDENVLARVLRVYQRYFNTRFQTYGRSIHFFVYHGDYYNRTAEARRADAADNFLKVQPFAAITDVGGNEVEYIDSMAQKGVLNFGASTGQPASSFNRYPKLVWNYNPTIEKLARLYSDYVCTKVLPFRVSFSSNVLENGKPRRLGLLWSNAQTRPDLRALRDAAKANIEACGGKFVDDQGAVKNGYAFGIDNNPDAVPAMASFKQNEVSTVIWTGGKDTTISHAAAQLSYRPEWIKLDEAGSEPNVFSKLHEKSVWRNAWVISHVTLRLRWEDESCWLAFKEADPNSETGNGYNIASHACSRYYKSLRQLFTGIQVAGPRLGPDTIDRGFHAIPNIASTNARVPACFYEPRDYTCVKDAVAEWWDSTGADPTPDTYGPAGCWRMAQNGKRYLAGTWPEGDVLAQKGPNDICNGYDDVY